MSTFHNKNLLIMKNPLDLSHTYYKTTKYLETTYYLCFGRVMRMNNNRYPKIALLEEVHRIR